jgi:hemerythrin-like domain-containing protein
VPAVRLPLQEIAMTHICLDILRAEHAALHAVLQALPRAAAASRPGSSLPDFELLRALVFYLDEFPEKRHHRHESELLFPKLRAKAPWARGLLDHLDRDHAAGERHVRDLGHSLLAFEVLGAPRRAAFAQAIERFSFFYDAHMSLEEREVLPLARQVLDAQDWAELDEAFLGNRDPLTGHAPQADHADLFERIAQAVPRTPTPARRTVLFREPSWTVSSRLGAAP